jgi:tetratricopeptide (TPR) repeat protein
MNVVCLVLLVLCGLPMTLLSAQSIPRGARIGREANVAPRMLVANPFVSSAADSVVAVQVGAAIRQSVQKQVGDDYAVVTQQQMSDALVHYGFSPNATLDASLAVTLAKNIGAPIVITSTMTKADTNRYKITMRLAGVNDEAGNVIEVTQQPSERLADFGARAAKGLSPTVTALSDAKACMNERETRPDQAAKAADKALKKVPDYGLAQFCLYQLAEQQKTPRQEAVKHLEAVVKSDPLSVPAWRLLAVAYQEAKDTANALAAAKQVLRIAPTDRDLRARVLKYLLNSGQPKAALDVAEEGLKVDPLNAELYDLKANTCLFLRDFPCAVNTLEQRYATDSGTVDTLFFMKIAAAAVAGTVPDTARLLMWARTGAQAFPNNRTILGYLDQAYVITGQIDSSLAVTQRIMARDTTAVVPALAAVQALAKVNRIAEGMPYVAFVKRYGNQTRKNQLAHILVAVSLTRLQGDSAANQAPDLGGAVELAQTVIAIADSTSEEAQYGNFVVGAARFRQGADLDPRTEQQKSCDMSRQEQQLMADAKAALTNVRLQKYDAAKQQYLAYIDRYGPRITGMLKVYCR